eukprot:4685357-Pleurochrysis_carterae.AAC.1
MERTGLDGAAWNSFEVEQTRWSVLHRSGGVRAKVRIARGVDAKPCACTRRACTGRAVRAK